MSSGNSLQLKAGQKLFEYEIVRQVGQGGFAAVFEAKDRVLGRQVAIKQLLLQKVRDKRAVQRFIQEARVAATLQHPNIVTIYGFRRAGELYYMVMEYLPGDTLRQLLDKAGKLPLQRAVALITGICEGLAEFHARGILHRDIKGENILLTSDGRPKVIDFGIAHVPEALGGHGLTQAGFQPSTLIYSSPEQIKGEDLDARSDVYQLGILLYTMLTGRHYIDLKALEQAAQSKTEAGRPSRLARLMFHQYEMLEQAICQDTPPGLPQLWQEVGALAGVVEKAMAKDKNERFKNAAEFAATLKTLSINTTPAKADAGKLALRDSRAFNRRGLAHASTRNYEQAIIDYSRALELDPQYAEALNNRSTAHLLMNNYGQAVVDCSRAIDLAPNFVAAYVNRGIAYTGLREYETALNDYTQALKLDPENVYAAFNQGNTQLWMGNPKAAIDSFNRAIARDPDFVAAYVNRGVAHNELGQNEAALADANRAIELNPDYGYAYYNRANVYREMDRHQEAVADYSKVVALNPEHRYAYENRADSYTALGREAEATEDYTRMISQATTIHPRRFSVARSMIMPATPLDFLTRA